MKLVSVKMKRVETASIETAGDVVKLVQNIKCTISVGFDEKKAPAATVLNNIAKKAGLDVKFHKEKNPEIFSPTDTGFFYESGAIVTDQATLIAVRNALKDGLKQYKVEDFDIMVYDHKDRMFTVDNKWERDPSERASKEKAAVEEAKGTISKLLNKAKRKLKGQKPTGHPLGDDLKDMMIQYSNLKKAGKGDSKKAKDLGEQIGKIKNSMRKK